MNEAAQAAVAKELTALADGIRQSIVAISKPAPTSSRAILDRYLMHLAPTQSKNGDSNLPMPVRRHRHNPERGTIAGKYNLLYFHIGNAILGYYDGINVLAVTNVLRRRVDLLMEIAGIGLGKFTVAGDPMTGYVLSNNLTDQLLEKRYAVPVKAPEQTGGKADA